MCLLTLFHWNSDKNYTVQGVPWWSNCQDSALSTSAAQVQSLVWELRSQIKLLRAMAKNKQTNKQTNKLYGSNSKALGLSFMLLLLLEFLSPPGKLLNLQHTISTSSMKSTQHFQILTFFSHSATPLWFFFGYSVKFLRKIQKFYILESHSDLLNQVGHKHLQFYKIH